MELEIKNKGFTLIETIVTLAVFSALVLAITGIAMSVVKGQRRAFVLQNTQETGRHVLETTSREIRMGVLNAGMDAGHSSFLDIRNAYEIDVSYRFNEGKIQRCLGFHLSCGDEEWQDLNTENVNAQGYFYVRKNYAVGSPSTPVSSVTLVLRLVSNESKIEQQVEINLQNTLALRSYEVL